MEGEGSRCFRSGVLRCVSCRRVLVRTGLSNFLRSIPRGCFPIDGQKMVGWAFNVNVSPSLASDFSTEDCRTLLWAFDLV